MGDSLEPGLEGHYRNGNRGDESGRINSEEVGSTSSPGRSGGRYFWDNFDIVHCTDGKARRIESGTFPLAHGIPGRVGRLRAYGNAIVPQVAAQFVAACMDVLGVSHNSDDK